MVRQAVAGSVRVMRQHGTQKTAAAPQRAAGKKSGRWVVQPGSGWLRGRRALQRNQVGLREV